MLEPPKGQAELLAHVHRAAMTGLRRLDLTLGEGPFDADFPRREIHITPLEGQGLAELHVEADAVHSHEMPEPPLQPPGGPRKKPPDRAGASVDVG